MSKKWQPLRGMNDLWGEQAWRFRWIENQAYELCSRYAYEEIRTPILEATEVFHRSLGETSDAVQKETYTFIDRSGDSVTLRPEGTAAVVRAVVSNQLINDLPKKFYYSGPMFRHERPQKGRLRQFHQIGVEALGYPEPWIDAESIKLAYDLLVSLGLPSSSFCIEINTLADKESRDKHREAFVKYLNQKKNLLSSDSQIRLEKNPLRIFDSKDPRDQEVLLEAPKLSEFLNETSQFFFAEVQRLLQDLNVPFQVNPKLVRGFDYYTHTVFECTTNLLGAQSAILAGGRYDHLVEEFGGPATPSFGWAMGLERIELLLTELAEQVIPQPSRVALLPLEAVSVEQAMKVAEAIRRQGVICEIFLRGKLAKRIQKAEKKNYRWVAFVGPEEWSRNSVNLKNLSTGNQIELDISQVFQMLKPRH